MDLWKTVAKCLQLAYHRVSIRQITQNGTDEDDYLNAVAMGGDGSVILAGYTCGNRIITQVGECDIVVVKFDLNGTLLWTWQVTVACLLVQISTPDDAISTVNDDTIYILFWYNDASCVRPELSTKQGNIIAVLELSIEHMHSFDTSRQVE